MKAILIGPYAKIQDIDFKDYPVIAVDQGLSLLQKNQINFTIAIGDFDGMNVVEKAENILRFPSIKNESDFELALLHCQKNQFKELFCYGFLANNRIDHSLNNLLLIYKYSDLIIWLIDEKHRIRVYKKGVYFFEKTTRYISFFAFEEAMISLDSGFAYPIVDFKLDASVNTALSNNVLTKGMLKVEKGKVLVIESNGQ